MRLIVRRLGPDELNHEVLWLSVSLGGLLCAVVWLWLGLPWPRCAFHDLTGLPCLTCGTTRSVIALLRGDFAAAWFWNPAAFLVLSGVALFDSYALTVLVMRTPRLRIDFFTEKARTSIRFIVIVALALNWIYLLSHYKIFAA